MTEQMVDKFFANNRDVEKDISMAQSLGEAAQGLHETLSKDLTLSDLERWKIQASMYRCRLAQAEINIKLHQFYEWKLESNRSATK